ncbi:MAG TPA: D-alanyl-D-alanine carboxypeptidase [Rhodospirillaceae bacterium]|nr:D-alanyl-D-alanine carboxypeptidase [Rhodospirillaceae bacterium]
MKKLSLAIALTVFVAHAAAAEAPAPKPAPATPAPIAAANVAPVETLAKQAVVIEALTGETLFAKDADTQMPTSSMSKVMTMYLVFEAIKNGKFAMDTPVTISETAWKQSGSRMFIKAGEQVKIEDLVRGVIIQSGNDAAVALAEAVAGSEGSFSLMMNDKAKALGMTQSHFVNATGLPDPQHYASARDLALLSLALIRDFPDYYHYYSEKEFTYNNIKQGNRNPLLYRNMDVDGVKTGHTDAAGYGLIASAHRDGRRIVTVVNGLKSMQERADEPAKLIEWAYREYGLYRLVNAEEKVTDATVWLGVDKTVPVAPERTISKSLPRSLKDSVKVSITVDGETVAPIKKGQKIGKATIIGTNMEPIEVALVATQDVAKLGFVEALWRKMKRKIGKE